MEGLEQVKVDIIKNRSRLVAAQFQSQKNIPDQKIYDIPTFESFKVVSGAERAYEAFKAIADKKTEKYMLLCYGTTGCGKTHLMLSLAYSLRCHYFTWHDITRVLKRKMNDRYSPPNYDIILDNYCRASKLIVDDIGLGTMDSNWENAVLEEIVDERYRNRLLTVLATNKHIQTLPDRVLSRFKDATTSFLVLNTAPDYRPLKRV